MTASKYLCAEIYRINNTTNSSETLNKALEDLKTKFLNNNCPKKLVETKINEIRARNFQKSVSRIEYEEKFKNLDYSDFQNITLPFTDFKCGKIAFEIKSLIRKICPNFTLNFSFTNIKLKIFISPVTWCDEANSYLFLSFGCRMMLYIKSHNNSLIYFISQSLGPGVRVDSFSKPLNS